MEPGVSLTADGAWFCVSARDATAVELCLFQGERETRFPMQREGDFHTCFAVGATEGQQYGYRAHGPFRPADGLHFDPAKLLVDPYAVTLDRRFAYSAMLSEFGVDTSHLVPRAIVTRLDDGLLPRQPGFRPGGEPGAMWRKGRAASGRRAWAKSGRGPWGGGLASWRRS